MSENNFVLIGNIDIVLKVLTENYLLMVPHYSAIKNNPQLRSYIDSKKDEVGSPYPVEKNSSDDEQEALPSSSSTL